MKINDTYYDQMASGYDQLYGEEQIKKLETVWQYLEVNDLLKNVKTILDVGCGTGISADFFSKKGFEVTGVDPSKGLLSHNANEGKLSKLVNAPAENLPFDSENFDLVVSFTAIQNFEDLAKGLEEIKRVGKKKFVLTFLNKVKAEEEIEKQIESKFKVKEKIVSKDRIYFIH